VIDDGKYGEGAEVIQVSPPEGLSGQGFLGGQARWVGVKSFASLCKLAKETVK